MRLLAKLFFWPFSVLYGLAVRLRNHLYNIGYKRSFSFDKMVISVGNLSVGGNGKTPMVEYLVELLKSEYRLATLSRGYGRTTKGFLIAENGHDAKQLGDEPLQIFLKYQSEIEVVVGEARALAIPSLLLEKPETQVIILDDAYQHRAVEPQLSILVTDYNKPFFNDQLIPVGRLREPKTEANRADLIVVTKCPVDLSNEEKQYYLKEIGKYGPDTPVFFSRIEYLEPIPFNSNQIYSEIDGVILVTGIAKSDTMVEYISSYYNLVEHLKFADHHNFKNKDIERIKERYLNLDQKNTVVITTEKDMVRLRDFKDELKELPLYYLPIRCYFDKDREQFNDMILNAVGSFDKEVV